MDGLTALGLASNIAQFIDFGIKLFTTGKEIYQSKTGASAANTELESIVSSLARLSDGLITEAALPPDATRPDIIELRALAVSCKRCADKLLKVLRDISLHKPNKKWQSARKAFQTIWNQKDIAAMESRLNSFRSQIIAHLVSVMGRRQSVILQSLEALSQKQQLHDKNVVDFTSMKDLAEQHRRLHESNDSKLDTLKNDLIQKFATIENDVKNGVLLSELALELRQLSEEGKRVNKVLAVLDSLRFPMMEMRHESIRLAHQNTFTWVFPETSQELAESSHLNFWDWLKSDDSLFWVTGKAGSGKSTYMKFISDDIRVKQSLRAWAGNVNLVTASFFFWNAGTAMQKPQEGLLRSLLYEIWRQLPESIAERATSRFQMAENHTNPHFPPWTLSELFNSLKVSTGQGIRSTRFCFFIDGLDEYQGDHQDVVDLMLFFSKCPDVKLCISSRPWNVFQRAFGTNQETQLMLQDHTKHDIQQYVEDNLSFHEQYLDPLYHSLAEDIAERANGVFLCLFLVVRSLRRGLTNYDTVSTLRKRLDEFPADLHSYFKLMLERVEVVYRERTARILLMALSASEPLPLMVMTYIEGGDLLLPNVGGGGGVSYSNGLIETMIHDAQKQLNACCQDLMEVVVDRTSSAWLRNKVDFQHRCIRDFLLDPEIHDIYSRWIASDFAVDEFIFGFYLLLSKLATRMDTSDWSVAELCDQSLNTFFRHLHKMELRGDDKTFDLLDEASVMLVGVRVFGMAEEAIRWGLVGCIRRWLELYSSFTYAGHLDMDKLLELALKMTYKPENQLSTLDLRDEPKYIQMVRLLLDRGADPNVKCRTTNYPIWEQYIHDACDTPSPDTKQMRELALKLLLNSGAQLDGPSRQNVEEAYDLDSLTSVLQNWDTDDTWSIRGRDRLADQLVSFSTTPTEHRKTTPIRTTDLTWSAKEALQRVLAGNEDSSGTSLWQTFRSVAM